jgi:hypothetical protein
MRMDYPPPPPPPDPPRPPTYPLPTTNVQPVAPPIPYPPPPPGYQPTPPPPPYGPPPSAYRLLPKDKTTAVLLAIFLGFITWMYTYERDAWKFWTAFAITVADGVLSAITLGLWLFVAIPVGIGVWIWGIVDTAVKSQQFYDLFPAA